jgi:hypothetical protein
LDTFAYRDKKVVGVFIAFFVASIGHDLKYQIEQAQQ